MNKLAQIQTEDSLGKAISITALENDLSNTETLFLKRKVENEIRVKLAKFANEISSARMSRTRK